MNSTEISARYVDHRRIEFSHHDALDARMLEQLFRRTAVAAADDQHGLRSRMREGGGVSHALVIEELIAIGCHQPAIGTEESSERGGGESWTRDKRTHCHRISSAGHRDGRVVRTGACRRLRYADTATRFPQVSP